MRNLDILKQMKDDDEVVYCEFLALGEPKEIYLPFKTAMNRYDSKIWALKGYLFGGACFVGIKTKDGQWIIDNNEEE